MRIFGIEFWIKQNDEDYKRCYSKNVELFKIWGHIGRFFYFNHNVKTELQKELERIMYEENHQQE